MYGSMLTPVSCSWWWCLRAARRIQQGAKSLVGISVTREMRALMLADPEWHDGEIVDVVG